MHADELGVTILIYSHDMLLLPRPDTNKIDRLFHIWPPYPRYIDNDLYYSVYLTQATVATQLIDPITAISHIAISQEYRSDIGSPQNRSDER